MRVARFQPRQHSLTVRVRQLPARPHTHWSGTIHSLNHPNYLGTTLADSHTTTQMPAQALCDSIITPLQRPPQPALFNVPYIAVSLLHTVWQSLRLLCTLLVTCNGHQLVAKPVLKMQQLFTHHAGRPPELAYGSNKGQHTNKSCWILREKQQLVLAKLHTTGFSA